MGKTTEASVNVTQPPDRLVLVHEVLSKSASEVVMRDVEEFKKIYISSRRWYWIFSQMWSIICAFVFLPLYPLDLSIPPLNLIPSCFLPVSDCHCSWWLSHVFKPISPPLLCQILLCKSVQSTPCLLFFVLDYTILDYYCLDYWLDSISDELVPFRAVQTVGYVVIRGLITN